MQKTRHVGPRTIGQLLDEFLQQIPEHSIEYSTRQSFEIHIKHLKRVLGASLQIHGIELVDIQRYVNSRAAEKGIRGRNLSSATIKKEIVTLNTAWRWAVNNRFIDRPLPKTGLRYPKGIEKPPFQTWQEIERKIARAKDLFQTITENPNLLSGLAFANANNVTNLKMDESEDDGILYSAELAMLPMENVELAVLSACDTGICQDETPGEGLIGIQRAFQVAGAKSVVASYWKVDDNATHLLMSKFYENLLEYSQKAKPEDLKNNQTTIRIDALRDAQLWMLNNPIVASATNRGDPIEFDPKKIKKAEADLKPADKNQRTHPRYWAAFQLSGDWR